MIGKHRASSLLGLVVLLVLVSGCGPKRKGAHITGTVTFKGQSVPAGWISFTPDVAAGANGPVKVYQIKDGTFDSSMGNQPPLEPGQHQIIIAGFDGKKIPFFGQGKQIFNPVHDQHKVPEGASTMTIVIPESAGKNVKIERTADE